VAWLADGLEVPERLDLATGHHLRTLRAADVDIDYPAVMGSRESLWRRYGEAWRWPPQTMTLEQDRADLARHEAEVAERSAFVYPVLDADETALLGCVYLDPPYADADPPPGTDAVVSWWVVDSVVGTDLERALEDAVPRWVSEVWGFRAVYWWP
jgi:hypothetical protein